MKSLVATAIKGKSMTKRLLAGPKKAVTKGVKRVLWVMFIMWTISIILITTLIFAIFTIV